MLSKIKSYINDLSKKVIKDKRYLIILVIVLLVIVWGFYGLVYYLNNKSKETFVGNNEFNTNSSSTNEKVATVYLFSADWCPHCKKAEPEWVNFEKEYNNKTIKEYKIQCEEIAKIINSYGSKEDLQEKIYTLEEDIEKIKNTDNQIMQKLDGQTKKLSLLVKLVDELKNNFNEDDAENFKDDKMLVD